MKKYIILLIVLNTFSVSSQGLKNQFGLHITSDINDYESWRMGLQLTYTDQRHFLSIGIKPVYPAKSEFGLFGYDLNYRIYPHLPKKIVNPFFRAGVDFKRINNSYHWQYTTGSNPDAPVYPAEWRDLETILAFSVGYGFDVNISKNFFISTSMNAAYFWDRHDTRVISESNPATVYQGQIYKKSRFSPALFIGIGYNFSFKRKSNE